MKGRFVDADTGKPIPRCEVKLTGHQATGYDLFWGLADWSDPAPVTTGDDGVFRFDVRLPSGPPENAGYPSRYHIDAAHPGHAAWFSLCTFTVLEDLGAVDYGDIRLPAGTRPRIKVVDSDGRLQPGVSVQIIQTAGRDETMTRAPDFGPQVGVQSGAFLLTDIDGYLHFKTPLPDGRFKIVIRDRKLDKAPEEFTTPAKSVITIVIASTPADDIIEGRLLDAAGLPPVRTLLGVADVGRRTRLWPVSGSWRYTRRDGWFTLQRPKGHDDTEEAVLMLAKNRRHDGWVEFARVRWGDRKAVIKLPAKTKITFQVRRKGKDGKPVEAFNLYCVPVDSRGVTSPVRESGRFAGGSVRCKLAPGHYRVLVFPLEPDVAPSGWRDIEVKAQAMTLPIELDATQMRSIRLTAGDQPVVGASVQIRFGPAPGGRRRPPSLATWYLEDRRAGSVYVARGLTDSNGRVRVRTPNSNDEDVYVLVRGPSIQSRELEVSEEWNKAAEIVIRAQRGAWLKGTVGPLEDVNALDVSTAEERKKSLQWGRSPTVYGASFVDLLAKRRPSIVVFLGDAEERWSKRSFVIDSNGRFEIHGLPRGRVRLGLLRFVRVNARGVREDPVIDDLGVFDVDPKKAKIVELTMPKRLRR